MAGAATAARRRAVFASQQKAKAEEKAKKEKLKVKSEKAAKQREFIKTERAAGRLGSGKRAQAARNAARSAEILRKRRERQAKKKQAAANKKRASKVTSNRFAPNIK